MTSSATLWGSRVCRGWAAKGSHGYFTDNVENMSFSVIWAFSEYKFYGLIINKEANNQYMFKHFLMKLMDTRKKEIGISNRKCWIIYDNASIHKTKALQRFAISSQISILTIPPYWLALNAAEKLILSIKKKNFQYNDEGR